MSVRNRTTHKVRLSYDWTALWHKRPAAQWLCMARMAADEIYAHLLPSGGKGRHMGAMMPMGGLRRHKR